MSALQLSNMTGGLLLELAVRSTLVVLLFAFALWLLRIGDVTLRYMTWRLVLYSMLLLPLASLLVPGIPLPAAAASQARLVDSVRSVFDAPSPVAQPAAGNAAPDSLPHPAPQRELPAPPWALFAAGLYVLVAGAMIVRIALGLWIMRRKAGELEKLEDPRLLERVNELAAKLELPVFPRLRGSPALAVPVTFGWKEPLILLPADWPTWPADKLDLILAHELSHIQRGDYLIRILSALNKSLYWFHPASWWLDKHLAELSEQLSDDAALRIQQRNGERYVEVLRDFMGKLQHSSTRFRLGIAMSAAARGDRRLQRILDCRRSLATSPSFARRAAVLVLSAPVLLFLARAEPQNPSPTGTVAEAPFAQFQLAQATAQPLRPQPARERAAMFSQAYVDALQGILEMEPSDAQALEQALQTEPQAWTKRLRLLAYYMRTDQSGLSESLRQRGKHVLWLIEHQPDSEILASPMGSIEAGILSPAEEQRAAHLWDKNLQEHASDARVFWNAARFVQARDESAYLRYLRQAVLLAPENSHYGLGLGMVYGEQLAAALRTNDNTAAAAISRELERITNPAVLEPIVRILQSEYNKSLMLGSEQTAFRDHAGHLFARLEVLNPGVDRSWVLPQIKPEMKGMLAPGARPRDDFQARFDAAEREIRRLPPAAFPELPPAAAAVLAGRGCLIPQPMPDGAPSNVIRGEFFRQGQMGWAVLCSVSGSSSILVFQNDADANPAALAQGEDRGYLQGDGEDRIVFSRQINPADRTFIVSHYRAYGGPEPPPIDHNGIDDAFLGKASVVWYYQNGEWLQLTGAD